MLLPRTSNGVSSIEIIMGEIGCVINVMYVFTTGKAQNKAQANLHYTVEYTQIVNTLPCPGDSYVTAVSLMQITIRWFQYILVPYKE